MHLLAREEIEELREDLKILADDELQARVDVLCDMALSDLNRRISGLKAARDMSQALNEGDGSYKP